jgi:Flp pilus assembly pilin Flp
MTRYVTALHIRMTTLAQRCSSSETGASMVEYAILVSMIAIALIVAVTFFGGALRSEFSDIGVSVGNA